MTFNPQHAAAAAALIVEAKANTATPEGGVDMEKALEWLANLCCEISGSVSVGFVRAGSRSDAKPKERPAPILSEAELAALDED